LGLESNCRFFQTNTCLQEAMPLTLQILPSLLAAYFDYILESNCRFFPDKYMFTRSYALDTTDFTITSDRIF